MPQTSYDYSPAIGIAGKLVDGRDHSIITRTAYEALKPGRAVVRCSSDPEKVRYPQVNKATITITGTFDASDTIYAVVNGVTTATITFSDTHANMMIALTAAINLIAGVVAVKTSDQIITITADDDNVLSADAVIGGGASATEAVANLSKDAFYGVVVHSDTLVGNSHPNPEIYDKATVVFDQDIVASETVTITVNGVAAATVTYATDHATTMALIKAALLAVADVIQVDVDTRTLTIYAPVGRRLNLTVAIVTAAGLEAAITQLVQSQTLGTVQYEAEAPVNILRKGAIYIAPEEALAVGDTLYMRYKTSGANTPGGWRNDTATNTATTATGANVDSTIASGAVGVLEINLP